MNRKIRFHKAAQEEVDAAFAWYNARSPKAAHGFVDELTRLLNQVAGSPGMFAFAASSSRRALLRRYPFAVIFKEQQEHIYVLAVAHVKRRPGYWRSR